MEETIKVVFATISGILFFVAIIMLIKTSLDILISDKIRPLKSKLFNVELSNSMLEWENKYLKDEIKKLREEVVDLKSK